MRLSEIQSRMAKALFQPLDASWGMQRSSATQPEPSRDAELYIRPNRRLSAFERLEIYNQSYWYRLLDALAEDFPGLCAIVGRKRFTQLSFAYLADCPSRSFTLRNLGSRLTRWLPRHAEWIAEAPRLALDMAHLEWADVVAFDGAERPRADANSVLAQGAEARFGLQPHMTLIEAAYPVDDLRITINALAEGEFAKARARARRVAKRKPDDLFLAVYRRELSVHYLRLAAQEYRLLRALGRGASLAAAIGLIVSRGSDPHPDQLRDWFEKWSRLGWLTAPGP